MKNSPYSLPVRSSFRDRLSEAMVNSFKPLYFLLRKQKQPWNITMDSLKAMPEGSLGNDLARFLDANGLSLMPRAELHDVYHVLFGYTTLMKDETCIQFIPLGNGRISAPYLASTMVALLFYPEFWPDYYAAFQRGRHAVRFHDWNFESMLQLPTAEVRRSIFG